jgi:uncharacterized linocin/CFP29 family protein
MDILKKNLAPISEKAWEEIEDQATRTLKGNLAGRKLVDMEGPKGWEFSSVNLGRVDVDSCQSEGQLSYGLRQVLPLTEARVHFTLNQWEMDNINRGAKDPDLSAVEAAAREIACFEENAIFNGLESAKIEGICPAAAHTPIALTSEAEAFQNMVEDAVLSLQKSGIEGPYALVLDTQAYKMLMNGDSKGYPLTKRVKDLLDGGDFHWSPAIKGGCLLSQRGGDFELTVGQDLSVGYKSSDTKELTLFITESFTFEVLEPAAAVELQWQ